LRSDDAELLMLASHSSSREKRRIVDMAEDMILAGAR
jgi:hypothetical protein